MADFFDEMAAVARDLLKPSDQGGLGARTGAIKYVRYTPGAPPSQPWEQPSQPTPVELPVRAQSFGVHKRLVGTEIANTVIMATDKYVICERIPDGYKPADVIEIDGAPTTIISVERIPAAGVISAIRFIVRQ